MLAAAAQPPLSGDHRQSHRRPLQPRNQSAASINLAQPKLFKEIPISMLDTSNKENVHPSYSYSVKECSHGEAIDPSSAHAARERLVRLRIEEERNEEVLRERGVVLDMEMKEILNRGEMQKELELEVDRLYRLKEIKLACMRVSWLRSLRDKEEEKKIKQDQLNKSYIFIQGRDRERSSECEAV